MYNLFIHIQAHHKILALDIHNDFLFYIYIYIYIDVPYISWLFITPNMENDQNLNMHLCISGHYIYSHYIYSKYLANTRMNFENHCDNSSSFVPICNNYLTMV
jgi:hypothetical protein